MAYGENRIQRGEVYRIYLDPAFGREIGGYKERPVAVVSINDIHQKTRIVMVVPGTTTERVAANIVRVDNRLVLPQITYFQCHQVRAIDQGRMTSQPAGRLTDAEMRQIEKAISSGLGLQPVV